MVFNILCLVSTDVSPCIMPKIRPEQRHATSCHTGSPHANRSSDLWVSAGAWSFQVLETWEGCSTAKGEQARLDWFRITARKGYPSINFNECSRKMPFTHWPWLLGSIKGPVEILVEGPCSTIFFNLWKAVCHGRVGSASSWPWFWTGQAWGLSEISWCHDQIGTAV